MSNPNDAVRKAETEVSTAVKGFALKAWAAVAALVAANLVGVFLRV